MSQSRPSDAQRARENMERRAAVPTADEPLPHHADGNALHRRRDDQAAGGADSSPHETSPSPEKGDAE